MYLHKIINKVYLNIPSKRFVPVLDEPQFMYLTQYSAVVANDPLSSRLFCLYRGFYEPVSRFLYPYLTPFSYLTLSLSHPPTLFHRVCPSISLSFSFTLSILPLLSLSPALSFSQLLATSPRLLPRRLINGFDNGA